MCVYVTQSCLTLCNPMDCSPPGFSVHGVLRARILEWVAIPFSRGSSRPRDWTCVSCIAGRFFRIWATREACTLLEVHIEGIAFLALLKDYKKTAAQKYFAGYLSLPCHAQKKHFFSNSLHFPVSSFPCALISTWPQLQFSAFLFVVAVAQTLNCVQLFMNPQTIAC